MNKVYDPLYKKDTKGKIRIWWMELVENPDNFNVAYLTVSGLVDGQRVTSSLKDVKGKNIGKSNETTHWEQGESEIKSIYTKKRENGYFDSEKDVDKPTKFNPMLASKYDPEKINYVNIFMQPKLDGIRCIAKSSGLWTRAGKEIVSCPHIFKALKPLFEEDPDLILDGELYNHELKDDFNKITSLVRKTKPKESDFTETEQLVEYHIYDTFSDDFFSVRNNRLIKLLTPAPKGIVLVETIKYHNQGDLDKDHAKSCIDKLYGEYLENGYEGQMLRYDTPYENKRSKSLIKRKEFITEEFKVLSVLEGKGNWAGYVKRFKVDVDGVEVGCGVRGDQKTLKELFESEKTPDWATVRYFNKTIDGSLRFPVVVDWGYGDRND